MKPCVQHSICQDSRLWRLLVLVLVLVQLLEQASGAVYSTRRARLMLPL